MLIQYNPNEMVHIYAIFISFSTTTTCSARLYPSPACVVLCSRFLLRWQMRKIDEQFIFNLWRFYASRNEPEILYVYIIVVLSVSLVRACTLSLSFSLGGLLR